MAERELLEDLSTRLFKMGTFEFDRSGSDDPRAAAIWGTWRRGSSRTTRRCGGGGEVSEWLCLEAGERRGVPCCTACVPETAATRLSQDTLFGGVA